MPGSPATHSTRAPNPAVGPPLTICKHGSPRPADRLLVLTTGFDREATVSEGGRSRSPARQASPEEGEHQEVVQVQPRQQIAMQQQQQQRPAEAPHQRQQPGMQVQQAGQDAGDLGLAMSREEIYQRAQRVLEVPPSHELPLGEKASAHVCPLGRAQALHPLEPGGEGGRKGRKLTTSKHPSPLPLVPCRCSSSGSTDQSGRTSTRRSCGTVRWRSVGPWS